MSILLIAFLALFLGSFVKGAIGFGLPLISTPILVLFYPLGDVITLLLLPVLVANAQQCWAARHFAYVLKRIWPMMVCNSVILLCGGWFIVNLDVSILRIFIGLLIIAHVFLADRDIFWGISEDRVGVYSALCGICSGVLGSLTSFMSFPSVQFLYSLKLDANEFVFAVGVLLATGFLSLWLGIGLSGFDVGQNIDLSVLSIVPVMIGMFAGNLARKHLHTELFRMVVKYLLAASGIGLIIRGIIS